MRKMFTSSTLSYKSCILYQFIDYINKLCPSVKGVAMKIKKLFSEIETS